MIEHARPACCGRCQPGRAGSRLKRASYCWKSLETRGSKLLFPKIRLGDFLQSYRLLVETQTIMMASNMIVYFIYFSGCVSTVVTGIVHEYNCDLMVAHVDVFRNYSLKNLLDIFGTHMDFLLYEFR